MPGLRWRRTLAGCGESRPGTDPARSAAGEGCGEGSPSPRKTVERIAEAIRATCLWEKCPASPDRGGFLFPSRRGADAGDFFHGLLALLLWAGAAAGCAPDRPAADLAVFGGTILTVDADFSVAEALAVGDGRILAVGSDRDIRPWVGAETETLDLEGLTVVPGLADNHLHGAGGGDGVDLSGVRTMEALLAAIANRIRSAAPGELVVTNPDWHEGQLAEQRLPLRRDLDPVAPDHPVVVVRGGHEYILNARALEKWNITPDTPVPDGGRIGRYPDGELNGELVDAAKRLVTLPAEPPRDLETRIRDQLAEHAKLHAAGLTSIRLPGGSLAQYDLLREMRRRGLLRLRVNFLLRLRARTAAEVGAELARWELPERSGDEWLRLGGVKLGVDGGFEGGLLREPYAEPWGQGGAYRGLQTMTRDAFVEVVSELARRGLRVATHAVGDAAMDLVLDGYEAADAVSPIRERRWTIEHGFLPRPEHFPRLTRLGVLVAAQHHLYLAGPSLEDYWGAERARRVTPMRSYLDAGIRVSAGSDAPVVPFPPLLVIHHFVTRETISGGVFGPEERITPEAALRLLTTENAWLTREEDLKGSLEPGRLADFVVLSDDLRTVPADETLVLMTVVGGEVVYSRPN